MTAADEQTSTGSERVATNDIKELSALMSTMGGETDVSSADIDPLAHAPKIPSSEEVFDMTAARAPADDLPVTLIETEESAAPRDPLFATHILEQEKTPLPEKPRIIVPEKSPSAPADEKIKRIRTYQSDVAETLKTQKTSVIQMVLSEQEKKRETAQEISPKNPKNLALIVLSAAFIVVGVSAAGFAAWHYAAKQKQSGAAERALAIPSTIFAEEQKEIDITDLSKEQMTRTIAKEVASANIRLDFIEQVYFTKKLPVVTSDAEEETPKALVGAEEFFSAIGAGMPEPLLRSLNADFFFGIHVFNGNQPFIILRTDYFESAFAGMLAWESAMTRTILPLFGYAPSPELVARPFEDIVVRNRDLRALKETDGSIVLMYLFYDKRTAIIATADETIKEVIDRLNRPAGVGN